jgi:hypothetical protein
MLGKYLGNRRSTTSPGRAWPPLRRSLVRWRTDFPIVVPTIFCTLIFYSTRRRNKNFELFGSRLSGVVSYLTSYGPLTEVSISTIAIKYTLQYFLNSVEYEVDLGSVSISWSCGNTRSAYSAPCRGKEGAFFVFKKTAKTVWAMRMPLLIKGETACTAKVLA